MTAIIQKDEDEVGVLRKTADPITETEFGSDKLKDIIQKMRDALHGTDDGVAIAAPQIGTSKRVFVVRDRVFADRGDIEEVDKEFINPELVNTSQAKHTINEGCLSLRNTFGKVKRHKQATVSAHDVSGNKFEIGGSGLLAQIFQHEIEHLDGKLFVDKANDVREIDPETRRRQLERQSD
jgi:peptide deformylase